MAQEAQKAVQFKAVGFSDVIRGEKNVICAQDFAERSFEFNKLQLGDLSPLLDSEDGGVVLGQVVDTLLDAFPVLGHVQPLTAFAECDIAAGRDEIREIELHES